MIHEDALKASTIREAKMREINYGRQMNPWARPKYDKEDEQSAAKEVD